MSDFNDDMFEGFDEEAIIEGSESKKPDSNRTFVIAIGVLGAIFVISLIALAVYAAVILPQRNNQRRQDAASINAANTVTAMAATNVAALQAVELTPSPTLEPTSTLPPSATSVVVFATDTSTPEPIQTESPPLQAAADLDMQSRTQTVAALLTQAAVGYPTTAADGTNPTALPTTGFADEVGLPGLLGVAVLLVGIIVLARRLRVTGNS